MLDLTKLGHRNHRKLHDRGRDYSMAHTDGFFIGDHARFTRTTLAMTIYVLLSPRPENTARAPSQENDPYGRGQSANQ
jgi:hypothetical protein